MRSWKCRITEAASRNPTAGIAGCCARTASGHAAAAPPSAASNSRRPMVTVIRASRARCVKRTIPRHERAVLNSAATGAGRHAGHRLQRSAAWPEDSALSPPQVCAAKPRGLQAPPATAAGPRGVSRLHLVCAASRPFPAASVSRSAGSRLAVLRSSAAIRPSVPARTSNRNLCRSSSACLIRASHHASHAAHADVRHTASVSSNALASFRSLVSKPSVNQP